MVKRTWSPPRRETATEKETQRSERLLMSHSFGSDVDVIIIKNMQAAILMIDWVLDALAAAIKCAWKRGAINLLNQTI